MNNNKGFTLVEVMVVLTILVLVIAALSTLFESSMHSWSRVNNQTELQQNLRLSLNFITEDIKNSKGILEDSNENKIILKMSEDNTLEYGLKIDNQGAEHTYHLSGQALYIKENGGNMEPVTSFINNLTFEYDTVNPQDATYVTISIEGKLSNNKTIIYNSGAEVKWKSFGSLIE